MALIKGIFIGLIIAIGVNGIADQQDQSFLTGLQQIKQHLAVLKNGELQ